MRRAAALLAIVAFFGALPAQAAEPAPAARAALEPANDQPLYVLALPVPAPAPEATSGAPVELGKADAAEPPGGDDLSLGWTLLRTFVVLGIVIMAIYLSLNFGLRRLMGISAVPRGLGVVQVVERIPLDQKRAMFVVKAAGEYLLIGGGDGALQLIAKLDATQVETLQQPRPPSLSLSPLLQKLLKRPQAPSPPAPGDP